MCDRETSAIIILTWTLVTLYCSALGYLMGKAHSKPKTTQSESD